MAMFSFFMRATGILLVLCEMSRANEPVNPPGITGPMRQREAYDYLQNPENRQGFWWEPIKYAPLWERENPPFATVGGEIRIRYESIENTDFGSGSQDSGGYLLTRFVPYVALTLPEFAYGMRLQIFGQLEVAFSSYDDRGPSPIDQDQLDVLQAFAKVSMPLGSGELSLQGGRQGISFGTERLLGTRYGPNIPLSFDGGLVRWNDSTWDARAFYLRPVEVDPDPLNNLSSQNQELWGVYVTRQLGDLWPSLSATAVDLYYLGYFDADAFYNSGAGQELRHTLGTRLFGSQAIGTGTLDWNYEGILQFGSFGNGSILAWSAGTETGYTFDTLFRPRFALRGNFISGDSNPEDDNLQTFNPLFPKGKYFGELTPVGPYNLINVLGALSLKLNERVNLYVQGGPYWRYSTGDAVYGVGGNIVRGNAERGGATFIGTQFEVVAEWNPLRELAFLVSYSQFTPGAFIRETGPAETIYFLAIEATVQF
jgi:hypothetical protein